MGQHMITPPVADFIDPQKSSGNTDTADDVNHLSGDYTSTDALDTRLMALGYTQVQCDKMTQNDKVYAVRLADDPESF